MRGHHGHGRTRTRSSGGDRALSLCGPIWPLRGPVWSLRRPVWPLCRPVWWLRLPSIRRRSRPEYPIGDIEDQKLEKGLTPVHAGSRPAFVPATNRLEFNREGRRGDSQDAVRPVITPSHLSSIARASPCASAVVGGN